MQSLVAGDDWFPQTHLGCVFGEVSEAKAWQEPGALGGLHPEDLRQRGSGTPAAKALTDPRRLNYSAFESGSASDVIWQI